MFIDDTIAAIATAPGEGGIGIIRISGSKALTVAEEIFKSVSGKKITDYNTRTLIYGHILDGDNKIDEVLLAFMKGPNSYTAEDVIEINCHGGFISVKKILELILSKDVRLAEEGEFTKRAFLNGRIDLSQAESVIDLINSKSEKEQKAAINQLEGYLSIEINKIKELFQTITCLCPGLTIELNDNGNKINYYSEHGLNDLVNKAVKNKEIINKIKPIIKNIIKTFLSNKKGGGNYPTSHSLYLY